MHRPALACAIAGALLGLQATAAPAAAQAAAVDVCTLMPSGDIRAGLAEAGFNVAVPEGSRGTGSCTWRPAGPGPRSVMIDAIEMPSEAQARERFPALHAGTTGRRLTGVGDEAVLIDGGLYGTISVKYRSGRVLGQVNLGSGAADAREAAVLAIARRWMGRLGAAPVVAAAPAPAAPPTAAPPVATPAARPGAPPDVSRNTSPSRGTARTPARVLPPLAPLGWPDADSAARARGLVRTELASVAAPGADRAVAALRLMLEAAGADTLLSPREMAAMERQVRAASAWSSDTIRRDQRSGGGRVPPDPRDHAAAEHTSGFDGVRRIRGGPRAPEPADVLATPSVAPAMIRTPPTWFRNSDRLEVPPAREGTSISTGFAEMLEFVEPWTGGHEFTIETTMSRRGTDGESVVATTYRQRQGATTDLCPSAEGTVSGQGVYEIAIEVFARVGRRSQEWRTTIRNDFTITARVGDDALPVAYELGHEVTAKSSLDGNAAASVTEGSTTGELEIRGGTFEQVFGTGESFHLPPEIQVPTGVTDQVEAAVVFAGWPAMDAIDRSFQRWWGGECLEVRIAEEPARTALRDGESAPFAVEVFHYQDEAVAQVPVLVELPAASASREGTLAPRAATGAPASLTFTAPQRMAWEEWKSTGTRLRSVSRRGRSNAVSGPGFIQLDDRARYLVNARTRIVSSKLGEVYDVTFSAYLVPTRGDPRSLDVGGGGYWGDQVIHDANCLDDRQVRPRHRTLQGTFNPTVQSGLTQAGGRTLLHLALSGLVRIEGQQTPVAFTWLDGIAVPTGSGTERARRTLPHGMTGVMSQCAGEVETIYEVEVMRNPFAQ